jgi:hypothetical protein
MLDFSKLDIGLINLILFIPLFLFFLYIMDYKPSKRVGSIKEDASFWQYLKDFYSFR